MCLFTHHCCMDRAVHVQIHQFSEGHKFTCTPPFHFLCNEWVISSIYQPPVTYLKQLLLYWLVKIYFNCKHLSCSIPWNHNRNLLSHSLRAISAIFKFCHNRRVYKQKDIFVPLLLYPNLMLRFMISLRST